MGQWTLPRSSGDDDGTFDYEPDNYEEEEEQEAKRSKKQKTEDYEPLSPYKSDEDPGSPLLTYQPTSPSYYPSSPIYTTKPLETYTTKPLETTCYWKEKLEHMKNVQLPDVRQELQELKDDSHYLQKTLQTQNVAKYYERPVKEGFVQTKQSFEQAPEGAKDEKIIIILKLRQELYHVLHDLYLTTCNERDAERKSLWTTCANLIMNGHDDVEIDLESPGIVDRQKLKSMLSSVTTIEEREEKKTTWLKGSQTSCF